MYRKTILMSVAALALATSLAAQSKTDFSGNWTLNVTKSEFGPMPGPSTRTDVIEQTDAALKDAVTGWSARRCQRNCQLRFGRKGNHQSVGTAERHLHARLGWLRSGRSIGNEIPRY